MNETLRALAEQFQADWPTARINLSSFSSGAVYLDIVKDGRHFLLRFFPDRREYGVDEVLPGEGFLEKYALVTKNLGEATSYLRTQVGATPNSVNGPLPAFSTLNSPVS